MKDFSSDDTLELVSKCAAGNEVSLRLFFERFSEDIYNFPIKVFHLSEDEAGDFFIYAFERLKTGKKFQSFQGKSTFKTWLFTVLRNMLIDWKRNQKELKTVSNRKINSDGEEYSVLENEPDRLQTEKQIAAKETEGFYRILSDIKIENRVIFKLAYIYYLNLEEDEIKYIQEKNNYSKEYILSKIMEIRDFLSDKELESIELEDKITSLYNSILNLREIQKKQGYKEFEDNLPQIDKIQQNIDKKYEQRRKLLERRHKGHFITKTPHKMITSFLQIPEGGVSISIQRVLEKIQKKISSNEI